MKERDKINYKIDKNILKDYVKTINEIEKPMTLIKEQLNRNPNPVQELDKTLEPIGKLNYEIKNYLISNTKEQAKIFTDIIIQIMNTNNGILTTKMIEPLGISRQYISNMEKNNLIEKVERGIYISSNSYEDSYYSFQQRYKKAIFSHMTALYFYGMTEEVPYTFTVTVPQRYHANTLNENRNIFYVSDEVYDIGMTEIETPSGNKVKVYDKERCICDIIRSKGRMDFEQVKKTINKYMQSKDKDITKISIYSKKMGISKKVMEVLGGIYYE